MDCVYRLVNESVVPLTVCDIVNRVCGSSLDYWATMAAKDRIRRYCRKLTNQGYIAHPDS